MLSEIISAVACLSRRPSVEKLIDYFIPISFLIFSGLFRSEVGISLLLVLQVNGSSFWIQSFMILPCYLPKVCIVHQSIGLWGGKRKGREQGTDAKYSLRRVRYIYHP